MGESTIQLAEQFKLQSICQRKEREVCEQTTQKLYDMVKLEQKNLVRTTISLMSRIKIGERLAKINDDHQDFILR